jgi:general stress protein YciG
MEKVRRGFATMSTERKREIASKGGKAAHRLGRAHEFTSAQAKIAGAKGGAVVAARAGHMAAIGRKGGAAVASDPEHMAAIGRLGGASVSKNRKHMSTIGKLGGAAISSDADHMAEIGAKGGLVKAKRAAGE